LPAGAFQLSSPVLKVDEALGLVFGWGMICAKSGDQYMDLDREGISQAEMLKSVTEFAATSQLTDDGHNEVPDGAVVFTFPLTDDVAKAFGIECDQRGWMVAAKPSPEVLAKFADGTYTGFSIGGTVEGFERVEA
jgi:hypothetical protein